MNHTKDENYRLRVAKETLADNLKTAIRASGWNNKKHGEMSVYLYKLAQGNGSSIGEGALGNWIYGASLPRYTSLLKLAEWLKCEPSDLLDKKFWDLLKGFEK